MASKHITPTTYQKIRIYKEAVRVLEKKESSCLCFAIANAQYNLNYISTVHEQNLWSTRSPWSDDYDNLVVNFPEIIKHKPWDNEYQGFWWERWTPEGFKIRIDILNEEIALLKAERKETLNKKRNGNDKSNS